MAVDKYVSLDATASGVQVAAALALDLKTAKAVNLTAGKVKKSVYLAVAKKANELLAEDAAAGVAKAVTAKAQKFTFVKSTVKKAVLAATYGGGEKAVLSNVTVEALKALKDTAASDVAYYLATLAWKAVQSELAAVISVNDWFKAAFTKMAAAGTSKVYFTTAEGKKVFVEVAKKDQVGAEKVLFCGKTLEVQKVVAQTAATQQELKQAANSACAQFVQSFDAALLTLVVQKLSSKGVWVSTNMDCFTVQEQYAAVVLDAVKTSFYELFSKKDWMKAVQKEFEAQSGVQLDDFVAVKTFSLKDVLQSNFLVA